MTTKKKPRADASYAIGYAKPPSSGQFKKGQSGNLSGRPKSHELSLGKLVLDEMFRMITVKRDGKVQRMPFIRALILGDLKKAAAGDDRALKRIYDLYARYAASVESQIEKGQEPSSADSDRARALIEAKLSEMRERMEVQQKREAEDLKNKKPGSEGG